MSNHMSGYLNCFEKSQINKDDILTFSEFNSLIQKLYTAAGKDIPTYSVIKDLYDAIDIWKDGKIDQHEWKAAFSN